MKKILLTLAAVVCCAMFVSAQDAQKDRNRKYNITLGKVQYAHHDDKMSADEAVGKIINDMAKVQQKSEKISAFGGIFFV